MAHTRLVLWAVGHYCYPLMRHESSEPPFTYGRTHVGYIDIERHVVAQARMTRSKPPKRKKDTLHTHTTSAASANLNANMKTAPLRQHASRPPIPTPMQRSACPNRVVVRSDAEIMHKSLITYMVC